MANPRTPPAFARRLLSRALPDEVREEVLGDLEQQYYERSGRAATWYWTQAIAFTLRFRAAAARDVAADALHASIQPGWIQDFRQARRALTRSWPFSLTAMAILGIGLGAATAIFSVYYGILLRPFPYPAANALVRIDWMMPTGQSQGSSLGDVALWRRASRTLSGVGLFSSRPTEIQRRGGPAETVELAYVNANTLSVIGVRPQIGRFFEPRQDRPGGDIYKVILSDALWKRRFGQDPGVIGRTLEAGGKNLEIVGVMPPGFAFPADAEMWAPVESDWATTEPTSRQRATVRIYGVVGRLHAGASPQHAQEELSAAARDAVQQQAGAAPRVRTLREAETGELRPYLLALVGGVACLLLICLANVSTLQLARAATRQREFAVRTAVGASMGRNLRIQLAESLLLVSGGALLGSLVAWLGLRAIMSSIPVTLPPWMQPQVDGVALAFCAAVAAVASIASGLLPAWRSSGQDANGLLAGAGRGRTERSTFRQALVVAEISLSVMLLVSALLLIQTLTILQRRDPGFRVDGLLTIKVSRTVGGASRLERAKVLPALHARVLARLGALPGVEVATSSSRVPFAGGSDSRTVADLFIEGPAGDELRKASFAGLADVSPGYFEAMRIPLVRGRYLTPADIAERKPVIVINQRAAATLWPDQDALGRHVTWGVPRPENPPATVVGIVGNIRGAASDLDRSLNFYYAYAQYPVDSLYYVLRTSVAPESLTQTVRRIIQDTEPSIAVGAIKPLHQWVDESLWQTRLWSWLLGLFAGVAVVLAAIGLYGVVTHLVVMRSKEMVIRMSLGATGGQVAALMYRGMSTLIAIGVAAGIAGALGTSRLIATLLFQISATDLRTYGLVSAMVAGVALLACGPPIVRASRANPISLLKEE